MTLDHQKPATVVRGPLFPEPDEVLATIAAVLPQSPTGTKKPTYELTALFPIGEPPTATIADITARLRQGRFPNEQAISQKTIIRLAAEVAGLSFGKDLVIGF